MQIFHFTPVVSPPLERHRSSSPSPFQVATYHGEAVAVAQIAVGHMGNLVLVMYIIED